MDVSKLRIPDLVAICEELGISVGQAERKPIMELLCKEEVSDVELQEAWELIRERDENAKAEIRERDEKAKAEKRERDERAKAEIRERDERAQAERQEREERAQDEREREKRARELAQKRLEIETLRQEVRSQRRTVEVEVTDSKYLAATFPHWFTYEYDPKSREKDLVSREERVVAPSRARTRQVAAETVGQKEKVEEEGSDLTDDQGLCTDGTTDAVPHNADSKPEALEVGGDRDPAKERDEVCQASDVCFLGDKDKASMVTPPQKSIQLKESSVEKSADREAEQEVGRPGRHPGNSEIKPGLEKRDQTQGCSKKASCSSRPSGKKEQKREQHRDPSAGGGCKSKGFKGSTERTRLDEKNPERSPSETSPPSQNDIGGSDPDGEDIGGESSPRSAFSVLVRTFPMKGTFGNLAKASFAEGSCHRGWDTEIPRIFIPRRCASTIGPLFLPPSYSQRSRRRRRKLSSGLGDGNREDIHPKKAPTDSGWRSKEHSGDATEPKLKNQGGPTQRRSGRRRWVFRSGPNASDRDRRLSARNSRKFSSGLGESKRQDTYPREPSIQSRNANNRLGGDTSKSTLDAETTRQSRSDEKKSCKESPSGRKSGVKPSHSSRASAARREVNRQKAGALLDNSTISTKYPGFHEYVLGSRIKLRREIKSGAEIKSELSDCGFEKTVESGDQGFSGDEHRTLSQESEALIESAQQCGTAALLMSSVAAEVLLRWALTKATSFPLPPFLSTRRGLAFPLNVGARLSEPLWTERVARRRVDAATPGSGAELSSSLWL
ncbi:hypothetical protein HPB47_028451 [Ixodes persulcatus]|uniref:Uncharacterized protein n=1 Tax=Ixodes persulcatus TaxID=34615 RepID=A0AC60PUY9_IXOPE|nr:hypothetical protein HPB47_028451 [Ixodes persulcatus]